MCVQDQKAQNVTELNTKYGNVFKEYEPVHSSLPESVDWRTAGAVTSVKDQVGHLCMYCLWSYSLVKWVGVAGGHDYLLLF